MTMPVSERESVGMEGVETTPPKQGTGVPASLNNEESEQADNLELGGYLPAWNNFPRDLVAGALMGGLAHSIVAPIERAKLLLQTQDSNMDLMGAGKGKRYRGMVDAIGRIAREEGVLSLWRGNGSSVMRYYPSLALNFAFKDFYRELLTPAYVASGDNFWPFALGNFTAGAAAGVTALTFVYPLDIAHTRLAADIGKQNARKFSGLRHFLRTIYQKEGIRGLYRGFPASVHGMVVHRSVYFGAFDTAKVVLAYGDRMPFWQRWVIAQGATTTAGLISYPLDTVRHRMMMQSGLPLEKRQYTSTLDCWRKIFHNEGLRSFYRGAFSNMVRGTGAALILVVYDEVKHLMGASVPRPLDTPSRP